MSHMIQISKVKFDKRIYPRNGIEDQNVREIARAYEAGIPVPPIVVDKKTKICIDGRHRIKAAKKLGINKLPAELIAFPDKAAMLEEAVRLNIHGRPLTTYDKAHCTILAESVGLDDERLRVALGTTVEHLKQLQTRKIGIDSVGNKMPLKATMNHMALSRTTKRFTKAQEAGHAKATGMAQRVYINQVRNMIENKMIDKENDKLIESLEGLRDLLINFLK